MKQKKRRLDWPAVFFSNPDETILEIGCHPDLASPSFRGHRLRLDPEQSSRKGLSPGYDENVISVSGRMDLLPFPDRSFDGVIILECLEQDSETTRRMLFEVKRVLKENGQCLIFLKNNFSPVLWISNPLDKLINILYLLGFSYTEIYWPYRSLRNVKRLIPLGSPSVERYIIRELTILHSEVNLLAWLKYLGMMILSYLNLFGKIIPQGYLIFTRS
jgi:SAM-dependent methyltransferase